MGIITLAFDDGYADTVENCSDFLAENGIYATFAIPSSRIGKTLETRPVANKKQIKKMIHNGHEIASHTLEHRNLLDVLNTEGEPAARKEMEDSKKELEDLFSINVDAMVFPFIENNENDLLRSIASEYYKSSRITTEDAMLNGLPVKDPFAVKGVAVTRGVPWSDYNELVDMAEEHDLWLIEVFHLVSFTNTKSANRNEPYRFFANTYEFRKHIQYIRTKNIPIMTQSQVIRYFSSSEK